MKLAAYHYKNVSFLERELWFSRHSAGLTFVRSWVQFLALHPRGMVVGAFNSSMHLGGRGQRIKSPRLLLATQS